MVLPPCTPEQRALAEEHLPFVYWLVKKFLALYPGAALFRADLEQAGALALVEACIRYQPARGVALTTWAERHVYGRIREQWDALSSLAPFRHVPRHRPVQMFTTARPLAVPVEEAHYVPAAEPHAQEQALAEALHREALAEVPARMPLMPTAELATAAFLENLLEGQTDRAAAERYGLSRARVEQLRRRGRAAFEEWAAEVRREFGGEP